MKINKLKRAKTEPPRKKISKETRQNTSKTVNDSETNQFTCFRY